MKIKEINIKNFRSIIECSFEFNDLLSLIGKNNSGKSNIIDAIEMLLYKTKANSIYDFRDSEKPIEIQAIFEQLSEFEKNKLSAYLDNNQFILKKSFFYKIKENGTIDLEGKMFYIKDGKENTTKPQNIFTGETLPEFYKVPAVRELKDEIKTTGTTYLGKFLDLIFESDDYDFNKLDDLIFQIDQELKREDENAPLIKSAKEIEEIMIEQFKDCELNFKIETPKRRELISKVDIMINDDFSTPIFTKGHGIQRSFIFSILLLYAKKLNNQIKRNKKDKKDIIIAIEEPEIYLHPQQQKIIYSMFKKLANNKNEQIQIIYTTHSSFMINIEDYKYLGFVSKKNTDDGTKINQCLENVFDENQKKEFQIISQFDPERNELFFADKIILCEGDTEKYSLPVIFSKFGINIIDKRISIIECGSKAGIILFQQVLNKFNKNDEQFNYYVMCDLDIPPNKYNDENEKRKLEDKSKKINDEISNLISNKNRMFIFNPRFEEYLSLSIGEKNKPYNARKKLLLKNSNEFPEEIKKFIENNF